jgi:hypothetical protein
MPPDQLDSGKATIINETGTESDDDIEDREKK